jgi:hypothetical protein
VTIAVRGLVLVLAAARMLNEPLPVRFNKLGLITVNQLALLLAIQVVSEVTLTVVLLADELGFHVFGVNNNLGCACVTVIVRVGAPGAVTVIVPVRWDVVVFRVALILNEPLPVRVIGRVLEIVNQLTLLLTVHMASEVTFTVVFVASELRFHVFRDKFNVGLACLTLIVRVGAPGAVTVIVPVR